MSALHGARVAGYSRQRGVTLLELLVALTLLSLVAWSVYAGIRIAGRSWDAAHTRTLAIEDLRLVTGVLRSHLSRAYPVVETKDRGWEIRFDGTARGVDFLAELPPYLGLGGLYTVSVRIESDGSSRRLTLNRIPFDADGTGDATPAQPPPEPRVLVGTLVDAELDYFGAQPPDKVAQWYPEWRAQRRLPSLVRLRIETPEGPWPDLTVQPAVDRARLDRSVATEQDDGEPGTSEADPGQPLPPLGLEGGELSD